MTFCEILCLKDLADENHDSQLTKALEEWPGPDERAKHHQLSRHYVFVPHLLEVLLAENSDL